MMTPMTKLPPITKLPKASITWPAASVPLWPSARISRVEARFSARRSIVEISRIVGKELKSSGLVMKTTVIRMRRSEEHTSELQSLMRISYDVFCLKKKTNKTEHRTKNIQIDKHTREYTR